ncbi:SDR family oxidoreductase [Spirosoma gilvum]
MENLLQNKVVAITGASSGIGKSIAIELARKGAKVVLGARREAELSTIAAEINADGGEAVYAVVDVSKPSDVQTLVDLAVTTFGRLDVMINNAGVSELSRIDALGLAGWDKMIDINLKGVLHGMAAAIPVFQQQQQGHIVNIISTSGLKIVPAQGVYAATKNAVRTLSEAFRQESDGHIRITGISPGFVKTELANAMQDETMKSTILETMETMALKPEAIAHAVIYAISQPSDVEVGEIVIRPAAQQ